MQQGPVFALRGHHPEIGARVFIAPTAAVIGQVTVLEDASIWFGAVLRGDEMPIRIGCRTNIQDGAVLHTSGNVAPTLIGDDVVVGHGAILHGCTIGDRSLIGMGSIILDGAVIEEGAVIAAGAIVPPGVRVPAGQLWLGNPAKFRRPVGEAETGFAHMAIQTYRDRAREYIAHGIGVSG